MSVSPTETGRPERSAEDVAQEIDVQTALALSRANAQAIKALSPFARHALEDALEAEIALQNLRGGVVPSIVVALLREELTKAA